MNCENVVSIYLYSVMAGMRFQQQKPQQTVSLAKGQFVKMSPNPVSSVQTSTTTVTLSDGSAQFIVAPNTLGGKSLLASNAANQNLFQKLSNTDNESQQFTQSAVQTSSGLVRIAGRVSGATTTSAAGTSYIPLSAISSPQTILLPLSSLAGSNSLSNIFILQSSGHTSGSTATMPVQAIANRQVVTTVASVSACNVSGNQSGSITNPSSSNLMAVNVSSVTTGEKGPVFINVSQQSQSTSTNVSKVAHKSSTSQFVAVKSTNLGTVNKGNQGTPTTNSSGVTTIPVTAVFQSHGSSGGATVQLVTADTTIADGSGSQLDHLFDEALNNPKYTVVSNKKFKNSNF